MAPSERDHPPDNRSGDVDGPDGPDGPDERTPLLDQEGGDRAHDGQEATPKISFAARLSRIARNRWISLVFFTLLIVIVLDLLGSFSVYRSRKMSSRLCLTPTCIHLASDLLHSLSPNYQTIDPCTDFEAIVCDGWRAQHNFRADQSRVDALDLIDERGQNILKSILESPYVSSSTHSAVLPTGLGTVPDSLDQQNFDQLQQAYNACMAVLGIQERGATPLEDTLQELARTFDNSSTWGESLLFLQQHGTPAMIDLKPRIDDMFPDNMTISASPRASPGPFAKEYYLDKDVMFQYRDAISQVLGALKPTAEDAKKHAADLVEFETKIAAITPEVEDLHNITLAYHPMSRQATSKLAPQLGLDFILKSLAPVNYTGDRMITSFPGYLTSLSTLMTAVPKETIQTYLMWQIIISRANLVEGPEVKPYIQFVNKLRGQTPDAAPERYKTCISHVDSVLGLILGCFFVEATFSAKAKDLGNQIVSDIRKVYIAGFEKLDWMDDSVKTLAADKVNTMIQTIGYPTVSLQDYYAGLNISNKYYDNAISAVKLRVKKRWSELGKSADKVEWEGRVDAVDASYNQHGNEIAFPVGIMQVPLFGDNLPGYINYGAFGSVVGHEVFHAFDPNGRQYDANGKLRNWWTNRTSQEFDKRAECFVEEYDNFSIPGLGPNGTALHVKGRQTLGENIADAGGLSAAWSAWLERRQTSPDKDLPGLSFFTQEQLFYIAYGSTWCFKSTPNALVNQVLTDAHAPGMYRIMGAAMMNSRGFREAFKCPQKQPVCEIW